MPLSNAFLALLFPAAVAPGIGQQTAAQAPTAPPSFQAPMNVAEPVRLALTPKLDGALDPEEWDPLVSSPNLKGSFEWEPGKLHFGGVTPNGNDLLISLDFGNNGWLVGSDNMEIRVSNSTGTPTFRIRQMDATQVSGPRWLDVPGMTTASKVAAASDGTNTTYEFTLDDAGLGLCPMAPHAKISVRLDAIPSTTGPIEPFLPRVLSPVQLEYVRSAALPTGLKFAVENAGVYVPAGEGTRLRFTFRGDNKLNLKRLSISGEGYAKDYAEIKVPFPPFDDKGRAFVDYNADIPAGEPIGFRIVRGTLVGGDGVPGVIEASFRVSPLVDISLVRIPIRSRPQAQTAHLAYYIRSNSGKRLSGDTSVSVPSPLALTKPQPERFSCDAARSAVRMALDVQIPAGTQGAFPVQFKVNANGQAYETVGWINVQ